MNLLMSEKALKAFETRGFNYIIKIKYKGDESTNPTSMPLGMIVEYYRKDLPEGWAVCDGGFFSGVVYPELEEILDYRYGGARSIRLFKLPDLCIAEAEIYVQRYKK